MDEIIEKYHEILLKCPLFKDGTTEEIKAAFSMLEADVRHFKKNEFLHRPYQPLYHFGLVLTGHVNVCADDINGNRMIMATVSPSTTFGEAICYLKIPSSPMYAYAIDETEILWLSCNILHQPTETGLSSQLHQSFAEMLARRTLAMNTRIQILSKLTLRDKIITLLSTAPHHGNTVTVSFNREDMANYLGTNRSALSRELAKMKAEGTIDYYRNTFRILQYTPDHSVRWDD